MSEVIFAHNVAILIHIISFFSFLDMMEKGTELKFLVNFPDGGKAVF